MSYFRESPLLELSLNIGFFLAWWLPPFVSFLIAFRRRILSAVILGYALFVVLSVLVQAVIPLSILAITGSLCKWTDGRYLTAVIFLGWTPCLVFAATGATVRWLLVKLGLVITRTNLDTHH